MLNEWDVTCPGTLDEGDAVMTERDLLQIALDKVREHRYADSSRFLTDIVVSLALGGRHRAVDLSEFSLLDEHTRLLVFDLITAKVRGIYHDEAWQGTATKMLDVSKGA